MNVLLIYPNRPYELIGWGDLGAIAEPLALEYLAAAAQADGHETRILDMRLRSHELEITLWGFEPDIIGFTGYSMHVARNLELCRTVKERLPNCKTVVGGHHATLLPEDYFEEEVDFVVKGEGAGPFRELLRDLESGANAPIPGVWRRKDGQYRFGGEQPTIDMDQIPVPERTLTSKDRNKYFIDWMKPIALLRTTVGCPFRCTFCSLWKIMDGHYYRRQIEPVVEELAAIPEKYVFLVDDEPFVNVKRMTSMAEEIRAAGVDKEYFAYCRIDSFLRDRELMAEWRSIGLRRVFFGIEAIFDDELSDYNKRQHRDQVVEGIQSARELDVMVFASFIVKPTYTRDRFRQLADFIRENEIDYPSFTVLTPLPGTEDFDHAEILDLQPNGRPNWEHFDLQHAVTKTTLPQDEFFREYRNLQMLFADQYEAALNPMFKAPAGLQGSDEAADVGR